MMSHCCMLDFCFGAISLSPQIIIKRQPFSLNQSDGFAGLALFAWMAMLFARSIVAFNGTIEGPVVVNDLFAYSHFIRRLFNSIITFRPFWAFPGLLPRPSEDLCHLPRGAHIAMMQRMLC